MALLQIIPPSAIWAALITGACLTLYSIFNSPSIKRHGQPLRRAPNTLPLIGNGILFLQDRFALFHWFTRCEQQYSYETLQVSVPTLPSGVVVSSPANVEFVLKHVGLFSKGSFFKERSWDLFGHGIINVDGELWRLQRRAGLSFLNAANLKALTEVELPRILDASLAELWQNAHDTSIVDLQEFFHEITTQLMGHMAYGMEMHTGDDFTQAFEYASGVTAERVQNPLWKLTELFTGGRMRASIAAVHQYGREIVATAVAARHKASMRGSGSISGASLIHSLLDSIGNEKIVADAALNYLSAGRDTTAQALTWVFFLLAQNPDVVSCMRAEIGALTGPPIIQDLPYTLAVFYETLRLYPPVPFEIKQAEEATTLPDGTFLPAKSIVLWCPWAMNRSFTTWGPDAEKFQPSRWLTLDEKGIPRILNRSAAEFPVFNGGPRTCLGKKMAEVVAVRVIAEVIRGFDIHLCCGTDRRSGSSLTLPMEGGLPCQVSLCNDKAPPGSAQA
ncbi:Cytochrome P450 94B3 [Ceratocystis fimbriata CBS 114723]|uniref:Cytochrome P450 94B3 n=1 Tax=Ceratocystis fimbriata CBS 114723 TaxID=1035309 RepID=A0A2C5WYQ3_9PEZI|nr:Cytochrome P450 94B3 [Ceratocystis fimbriata CBS 114723]